MKKSKSILFSLLTIPALSALVIPVVSCSNNEPAPDTMMVDYTHNLTFTADGTVTGFNGKYDSELVIPEYLTNEFANSPYKGYKVRITKIGENAFKNTNITKVTIPNSVEIIDVGAFRNASLTKVTIPDSVKTIEIGAFNGTQLTEVTIPNSVEYLAGFNGIETLTQITIPNSVKTIGASAFYNTPLTSITIPDSVEAIWSNAFNGTNLTEVMIPDSVKEIKNGAFNNTKITQVALPADCKYVVNSSFPLGCKVTGGIKID